MSRSDALRAAAGLIMGSGPAAPAGCVIGVDIDGVREVVVAGTAAPERGADAPMRRSTQHDLASVSKAVGTTTALHRLASLGALGLDDRVVRFVPTFAGHADTTLRDLLLHRAGLREWQPLYLAPGREPYAALDALPPAYPLGVGRHYSDLGFMTLGRVVESVAGAPLDAAMRQLVAEPLGLATLGYGPVAGDVATSSRGDEVERRMVATGVPYPVEWSDDGFAWRTEPVRGAVNDGNAFHAFAGIAGHAGLFGTIDDLLDLASALSRADARPDLWSSSITAEVIAAGPDPEQALGWRLTSLDLGGDRVSLLEHPGFTGCAVGFVPGRGIAVAFASNRLLADEPVPTDIHWRRVLEALAPTLSTQE